MLAPKAPSWSALLDGYHPPEAGADELLGADGRVRAHWAPVLDDLAGAAPQGVDRRFAAADRHLHSSGVYYRVYNAPDDGERAWPLSPVPLVLAPDDWRLIEAGVIERAGLLEAVLADLYGPASLVGRGLIPAPLVAGNPDFLRPLVGVSPRGGQRLVLYAADLTRGADGRWWVLGDRAQAPSGMGYALENRLAVAQAFPALARDMHVERLAPFFQALRETLAGKAARDGARIGLLTPGPANETYFEHSYLARYLGFLLVEGGDLAVQDGALYVRTIEGLKRLDVLLRRLDADFCDPLELAGVSRLGVPGLVQAVRSGALALANALGAGLIEAPAMMAVLPGLARALLGRDLALPSLPTTWCGDQAGHEPVAADPAGLTMRPAFGRDLPDLPATGLDGAQPGIADRLARRPLDLVAQERLALATMPVWSGGRLVPKPFSLRVFAVATPGGWTVMPGGFCRVAGEGAGTDPALSLPALSMQSGGRSADVWVRSHGPVEPVSLLPGSGPVAIRRVLGHLPARAADNLFWLGRYLERAETTLRLVSVLAELAAEEADARGPVQARLVALMAAWGLAETGTPDAVLDRALSGPGDAAVPAMAAAVARTSAAIRERLAPDSLRVIEEVRVLASAADPLPPIERAERLLRALSALSGLAQENMHRISGWRFMQVGRRLERAITVARLARRLADPAAGPSVLDALLGAVDCHLTYRSRYLMGTARRPVLDLVVLDEGNPRSLAFQLSRLAEHLAALPGEGEADPLRTGLGAMLRQVMEAEPEAIDEAWLLGLENRLSGLSNEITARYFGARVARGEAEGLG